MAPVEIRFLGDGWEKSNEPVEKIELVTPENLVNTLVGKVFKKGSKHFSVTCGTGTTEEGERRFNSIAHKDDGAKIFFWDEGTEFNGPEGSSLRLDKDIGSKVRTHALAEIGRNGSVKLTVDGEDVAEIRHISR